MVETLWEVRLLGGLRWAHRGRVESRFRTQKTAALLAYLALYSNRLHPREELAARFWPEDSEEEGRRSLRVALNSLRRQMETPGANEGELFIADRATIGLRREAFVTDVERFEEMLRKAERLGRTAPGQREERVACYAEASGYYVGPLLSGLYEDWALNERERLHTRFLDALEDWTLLLRELGRESEADAVSLRREQSFSSDSVASGTGEKEAPAVVSMPVNVAPVAVGQSLPLFFSRFFGREAEIATVREMLGSPSVPVITLIGPGGIGKTRLSVEAVNAWGGAAVFVPLAAITRGEEIADALREALHLPAASGGDDAFSCVTAALREKSATGSGMPLLVLDNFEQIESESAARFIARLLRTVPGVQCLVSSRRRLGVPGECPVAVQPLALPDTGALEPSALLQNASAALFADRARSVSPDFAITTRNAASVATLCTLLEGVPLAIELAAAWASALTSAQMVARLGDRFQLLVSRKTADRVERHRSLWAAISWSYDLLTPELRLVWRRLSVFQGGFTVEMAQHVTGQESLLDALARLRERSLLRIAEENEDEEDPRYELLESLREFAAECVEHEESVEEQKELRERHVAGLQTLAEAAAAYGYGPETGRWLRRLRRELPNIRAALSAAERGEVSLGDGLALAGRLNRLWNNGGYLREGYEFLSSLLRRADATRERERIAPKVLARALFVLGELSRMRIENAAAERYLEEAVTIYRTLNDERGILLCLPSLGSLAESHGDVARAEAYHRECLERSREQGHRAGVAVSLHNIAQLLENRGEMEPAAALYEEELTVRREIGEERGIALALGGMGAIAHHRKDFSEAESYFQEAIRLLYGLGEQFRLIYLLVNYADLLRSMGDWQQASVIYGGVESLQVSVGTTMNADALAVVHAAQEECRQQLAEVAFSIGYERGRTMPLEALIAFALRESIK